jgi:hypothetical protein
MRPAVQSPPRKAGQERCLARSCENVSSQVNLRTAMLSSGHRRTTTCEHNLSQQLVLKLVLKTLSQRLVLRKCQLSMSRCQLNRSVSFPPKVTHLIDISKSNTRIDSPRTTSHNMKGPQQTLKSHPPHISNSKQNSAAGNRTRVFRVTGGNTNHYATVDLPRSKAHPDRALQVASVTILDAS